MSLARPPQRRIVRARKTQAAAPVLSRLAEVAPVGMVVCGLTGHARYINPAFTRLLGHQLDPAQPFDGFGLFHHDDSGAARQHLERLARGEADSYRGEHRLRHSDGQPIWVMLGAALYRDADGQPDSLIIQVTSIELQKRAEEALSYSENRWNSALESAGQGVWDYDLRRDTMFYSSMWRTMRGIPQDEEIGASHDSEWHSRIHPEDVDRIVEHGRKQGQGLPGYDTLEYREKRRDGQYIWILSRGGPIEWDDNGKVLRAVGTDTDITRIKTVEQQLAAEKERLRVTIEAMADGMIATDAEGCVTFLNQAAEQFIGYSEAEARGIRVDTIFPLRYANSDQPAACPARLCLDRGEVVEGEDELVLVGRDGVHRDIRCSASPVTSGGRIEGVVLVFQDVSQSRALQRQLVHSASHDDLTGLPNRAAFDRALTAAIASAQNGRRRHCLLYVDLDRFKPVNDTAGHAAGDALLKQIAQTIRGACRGHDMAARIGGDEFAVLLEDCPLPNGMTVAEKIVRAVGALDFAWGEKSYRIGASIGVTAITAQAPSRLGFLGEADAACYAAKGGGRGMVVSYPQIAGTI